MQKKDWNSRTIYSTIKGSNKNIGTFNAYQVTFRILRNQIHEAKPQSYKFFSLGSAASMTISLKQADKGINWSLTLSLYDFLAFTSARIILQLYFTFKNKMIYATEPADLQPQSSRCCSEASHILKRLPASLQTLTGKKNPTTYKQRGCEVLLVQTRLGLQQSNTWSVTTKSTPAKKLLGWVVLSIPTEHRYLTKPLRRWKNIICCMQVWRALYPFYLVRF